MSIYKILLDILKQNELCAYNNTYAFQFDLKNKSILSNRGYIVKNGLLVLSSIQTNDEIIHLKNCELISSTDLFDEFLILDLSVNPYEIIDYLYQFYKYSTPSKESNKNKLKFYAHKDDKLTDQDLINGKDRIYMQCVLEGYILLSSLMGWIKWETESYWFIKTKDKDLILLREWIMNNKKEDICQVKENKEKNY